MRNKICLIFVMIFIIFISNDVYAEPYSIIKKSDSFGELYDSMPTEVKKGDIISVKIALKDAKDMILSSGEIKISWDRSAFEIVEIEDKFYRILNSNINYTDINFNPNGSAYIYFGFDESVELSNDNIDLFELTFKVRNDVNDGIYYITQNYDGDALTFYDDVSDETFSEASWNQNLRFQVGKSKYTSTYSKDDISSNSYVIGTNLFTREVNDEYNGILTTEYIMLASKTIKSDKKDDMIIYAKNARGKWINAITASEITPPDSFKIEQIDMKPNYLENGYYSDNDNKTIVRIIQINDNEAILSIENSNVHVHGIASINNKVATLVVGNKNYKVTISNDSLTINTNDEAITSSRLQKKANASLNDYLNNTYGHMEDDGNPVYYMKSNQTGKYSNGRSDLYFVRINENNGIICMKENGSTECDYENYADKYYNGDFYTLLDESAYIISLDEVGYGLKIGESEMNVICEGRCENSPYVGKFQKEANLSFDDIIYLFTKNEIEYNVTIDDNNGDDPYSIYVPIGKRLDDVYDEIHYYTPTKDGYIFVEWQLDGRAYPFGSLITKPITLVAKYEKVLDAPTLSIASSSYDADGVHYTLKVDSDQYYDGFMVYQLSGPNELVGIGSSGTSGTIVRDVGLNSNSQYYAITYRNINGQRYFSPKSNNITLKASVYTVIFNANNGSTNLEQNVLHGNTALRPVDPENGSYTFDGWQLNGSAYDFTTPVTSDITLVAKWGGLIETCPGCKFMYTTNEYQYGGENNPNATEVSTLTGVTSDYRTLNKNKFLGFTETQDGKIDRAYVCGIKGENPNQGTPFCIEGSNGDSLATYNETLLNTLYGPYNDETELGCKQDLTSSIQCDGAVSAFSQLAYGDVNVNSDGVNCSVNSTYLMHCFEY